MNWYFKVFSQFADFSGRARRKEYWMFLLFNLLALILASVLDTALGLTLGETPYGIFYIGYALIAFLPGLAVGVRRLNDVGKSGWMMFISLIPIIGAIWLLVLLASDSQEGENEYGPNPKEDPVIASTVNVE